MIEISFEAFFLAAYATHSAPSVVQTCDVLSLIAAPFRSQFCWEPRGNPLLMFVKAPL